MKSLKILISSLLALFVVALGSVFLTSSTTVEQSNNKALTELSAELADMKEELTNLKTTEENEAVSANPYLGEVILFAGNYAPRGWALCEGQLLLIASNSALFSILGTTYGGDGRTTFGLPDLRGRSPIGVGSGDGLTTIKNGQKVGQENATLSRANAPVVALPGYERDPSQGKEQYKQGNKSFISVGNTANTEIQSMPIAQPIPLRGPSLGMHYIIALQGVYPSRN